MDAIRNVIFSNCIIQSSNRAIGIQNRDEGVVENIIFDNIIIQGRLFDNVWWGKAEPIYVTAFKRQPGNARDANWRFAKGQTTGRVGEVRNILFNNITAQSENGVFVGGEKGKVSDIRFQNIHLTIDKTTHYQGGLYDLRPSDTIGILETETAGFYFEEAAQLCLTNCNVSWGKKRPSYCGPALFASHVHGIEITNCKGESAFPGTKESIVLNNCEEIKQDNSFNHTGGK